VLLVVIGAVPPEAFRVTAGFPVGGLVTGSFISFDIGKSFRQDGPVAAGLLPMIGKSGQSESQRTGGEVGHALRAQKTETAVHHHQGQTLGALPRGPANPVIPVGELVGRWTPVQQSDPAPIVLD